MCFDFLYNFSLNISQSTKKRARYDQKCLLVFMYSSHYSCQTLKMLEFAKKIVEEILKYQIS